MEKRGGRTIHSTIFVFKARKKGRAHDTFDKLCPSGPSREVPSWGGPHGEPRRGRYLPFKRAIWSTLWLGGQNPSLDCSWPAPGCFRGRIVREWAQVAEKSARVSTLRGKKCETFLPITNKQGRAHDTFDKLSLQVLKKGAGARYIRQFLSSRVEKRGRAHDTFDKFLSSRQEKQRKKGRAHDTFDKLSLQVPQGRSRHGGDPTESPEEVDLPTIQTGHLEHSLAGRSKPQFGLLLAAPGCFRGRIVREWAQVAEKSARVSTLRRKKCETFLPSTNKQGGARYIRQIVPPSVEKRGGRTIHSSIFCLQGWKKGAGARYIRQFLSSRQEKRGGRTIHSTNCPFRSLKGGPLMGGTPRRAPKRSSLHFERAIVGTFRLGPLFKRVSFSGEGPHGEPRRG